MTTQQSKSTTIEMVCHVEYDFVATSVSPIITLKYITSLYIIQSDWVVVIVTE